MIDLRHGDCLEVLRSLPDSSVDAVVTDPPYGLSFMGRKWDYDVPSEAIWRECLRVLKPGGHLLAFAGTRTQHRMAVRIEDAGFEIREMIAWVYSSGFPKSLNVSKAIDKAAGAKRQVVGVAAGMGKQNPEWNGTSQGRAENSFKPEYNITAPATEAAKQWQGWGTALKPALEPITVARKPLIGTVADNVLQHGTGAINVDGCRVAFIGDDTTASVHRAGRWPANLIHDGSEDVVGLFPEAKTGAIKPYISKGKQGYNGGWGTERDFEQQASSGSAARFFYCAKASKRDRDEGLDGFASKPANAAYGDGLNTATKVRTGEQAESGVTRDLRRNHHPTVKPTDLMRYLCRLVTPPGGIVLDPFMGSGSTGKAAVLEGFRFIGIEREAEYIEIARARIGAAVPPLFEAAV